MFKKIIFIIIPIIIFFLSYINAMDESDNTKYILMVSLLAMLPPALSACIVFITANKSKVMEKCVYIIGAVGLIFYTFYAANGKTDPFTSAHMHVIAFPIIYVLFSILVMAVGFILALLKEPESPHENHSESKL